MWVYLLLPQQQKMHVRGPMNTGHEDFKCSSCHTLAKGTLRQQIQANLRYALGMRATPVNFGYREVTNSECLACHARPNDRHPVFRFFEPRFKAARAAIQPQFCVSCHQEHQGRRVTLDSTIYCVNCHKETKLKSDPISTSHEQLITAQRWESCLGCHDFHGNHVMKTRTDVAAALPVARVVDYFRGAPSPYAKEKHYHAKEEQSDNR